MEPTASPIPLPDAAAAVLVGSYAEPGQVGVRRLTMTDTDVLVDRDGLTLANASWLEWWDERRLLALSELPESRLSVVEDTGLGRWRVIASAPTLGTDACHLDISPDRRHIAVANYSSGSVSLFAAPSASDEWEPLAVLGFHGSGPVRGRQDEPHAHQVTWLDEEHLVVCDLGCDLLRVLRVVERTVSATEQDPGWRSTTLTEVGSVALPPGFGPRHLVLRRREHLGIGAVDLAVGGELSGQLASITHEGTDWVIGWRIVDLQPGTAERREDGTVPNQPSGLVWFGDDLVLANRGIDTITRFAWHPEGHLTPVGESSCQGRHPRDLVEHKGHLWVANQHSDSIVALSASPGGFAEVARASVPAPARILVR